MTAEGPKVPDCAAMGQMSTRQPRDCQDCRVLGLPVGYPGFPSVPGSSEDVAFRTSSAKWRWLESNCSAKS